MESTLRIDILVGGLRISTTEKSTTPGPRSHILGFSGALVDLRQQVRLFLVSERWGLRRFSRLKEGVTLEGRGLKRKVPPDLLRLAAAAISAAHVRSWGDEKADVIYERVAVYQDLTMFHPARRAFRVVESNGIMSRESLLDRKAIRWYRLAAYIERRLYRRADCIVAVSNFLKGEIIAFAGIPESKILVLRNAAPADISLRNRSRQHDHVTVGYVGSIVAWQQLDLLLEALADSAPETRNRLRLEVVGDGPELPSLREKAVERGIAHLVQFWGNQSRHNLSDIMAAWDVGFSGHKPSSSQTMYHSPLKLYEYVAAGLPVISTQSDDFGELQRDGMPGILFSSLDDLKRALTEIVAQPFNRGEDDWPAKVLEKNSWTARADTLLALIKSRAQLTSEGSA